MNIEELLNLLSSVIVGLISAFLASRFAFRKFKKEKVWDERRESYKNVIEALEELLHWAEQERASYCCEPIISGEVKLDDSLRKISKFSSTGALIFSEDFHKIVKEINTQILQIRFKIGEDSKPDLDTEQGVADWRFALAIQIRSIIEANMPKLIEVATREAPSST